MPLTADIHSLWLNIIAAVIWATVGWFGRKWATRGVVPHVEITVQKIVDPEMDAIVRPRVLIVIYAGMNATVNPKLSPGEQKHESDLFTARVNASDYESLDLSVDTPSIGHTIRAIDKYKRTLEKVVLITTRTSKVSVPLLRAYAKDKLGLRSEIEAPEEYCLNTDDDIQLTRNAYEKTKLIFANLKSKKLYDPRDSRTLVDITGGPRALQTGVLFACLGRDQNIHLIGSKYGPDGRPLKGEAFPMIVHFAPHLRRDNDS